MKRSFLKIPIFIVLVVALVAFGAGSATSAANLQATPAATMAGTAPAVSSATVDAMLKLPAAKATGDPIPVGLIFDLTGPTSSVGKPYSAGELGYIDWLNNHGGIDGRPIQPFSADFAYKVDQAQQLYTQYTTQDKVVAFMGWGTGDTEALRPKITDDEMPFMSASYSASLNDP
ncbi:MAG TPA: ABC transporter substrate-binding protein, partial [Aggregatilineales bacterium]|nr:ABC transporter substrate-binding protein [Aggregatilineales bacterium]